MIAEKRQTIEETLWAIHEADIGDFFETVEVAKSDKDGKAETDEAGRMLTVKKQRPKLWPICRQTFARQSSMYTLAATLCHSFIPSCIRCTTPSYRRGAYTSIMCA